MAQLSKRRPAGTAIFESRPNVPNAAVWLRLATQCSRSSSGLLGTAPKKPVYPGQPGKWTVDGGILALDK
jgi:hypothetical protein